MAVIALLFQKILIFFFLEIFFSLHDVSLNMLFLFSLFLLDAHLRIFS